MHHQVVAREVEILQGRHCDKGECRQRARYDRVSAQNVIDALGILRRRIGWESACRELAQLIVAPNDAGPCRVRELNAVTSTVVCAAAATHCSKLGRERSARVSTRRQRVRPEAVACAPKVCIAVAIAHCRERVCGADGVDEEPRATKRDALWQADGEVGVVASDASA